MIYLTVEGYSPSWWKVLWQSHEVTGPIAVLVKEQRQQNADTFLVFLPLSVLHPGP